VECEIPVRTAKGDSAASHTDSYHKVLELYYQLKFTCEKKRQHHIETGIEASTRRRSWRHAPASSLPRYDDCRCSSSWRLITWFSSRLLRIYGTASTQRIELGNERSLVMCVPKRKKAYLNVHIVT
jgi:hypothetical protein